MKLIDNASGAWRMFSVQAMALIAAVEVAWMALPPEALAVIGDEWQGRITLAIAVLGVLGRLVDQGVAKQ